MLNTKYLGKAVGIQYQGVQDNSVLRAGQGGAVGVIVGQFKRGSLDKAFPVTIENYRARLGYDPTNPHYVAVQDLFALGYPLVWIQRLGDSNSVVVPPVGQISCDGATDIIVVAPTSPYNLKIDGQLYELGLMSIANYINTYLSDILTANNNETYTVIGNVGRNTHRLEFIPQNVNDAPITIPFEVEDVNPTIIVDSVTNITGVCLASTPSSTSHDGRQADAGTWGISYKFNNGDLQSWSATYATTLPCSQIFIDFANYINANSGKSYKIFNIDPNDSGIAAFNLLPLGSGNLNGGMTDNPNKIVIYEEYNRLQFFFSPNVQFDFVGEFMVGTGLNNNLISHAVVKW